MTRTDVHSPKNLVTEDYDFFGCGDYGTADEPGYSPIMEPRAQQLLREGWKFADVQTGGCQHCGARLRYYAILLHPASKSFVRVGETCLDNRFSLATAEFHKLRKAAKLNRERVVLAEKRAEWIKNPRNAEAVEYAREAGAKALAEAERKFGYAVDPEYDNFYGSFYCSIAAKFDRYGELSDRQVDAILKGKARDAEREVKRAAERAEASPVIEGKIQVTGEVVKIDISQNAYGSREVMTVRDDRGFKVWGTQPRALYEAQKGSRVTFTATVTKSDRDETFGFFKRPSKAAVLDPAVEAMADELA